MTAFKTIIIALLGLALVACTQQQQDQSGVGTKTVLGGALGAAGGGLLASQLGGGATGIAAGVLLGGLLGGLAGNALDQNDREYMNRSTTSTLETSKTGQTAGWQNPDSGNSGTITPTRTFQRSDGTYCREFSQTVNIGGEVQQAHGTACRQPDGTWKIVE